MHKFIKLTLAVAVAAALSGCAAMKAPPVELADSQPLVVNEAFNTDAETYLPLDWEPDSAFILKREKPVNVPPALTKAHFKNLSFSEIGVSDTLRMLAAQAGLTVRMEGGFLATERYGPVTIENLSGNFIEVLDEMSEAMGFFYEIKGKSLVVRQDDQFVVSVPPVLSEDTLAGITNTIQHLGAEDTFLDRSTRHLTFRANRKALTQIERYLNNIRETRSIIVYDMNIFQVDLNHGNDLGVDWSGMGRLRSTTSSSSSGFTNTTTNGNSELVTTVTETITNTTPARVLGALASKSAGVVGLMYTAGSFSIDGMVNYLRSQGKVKSLSQPKLSILSGSRGVLRVGDTKTYISKVGSSITTGVAQTTAETSTLATGLTLTLNGDMHDKTVFTHLTLAMVDDAGSTDTVFNNVTMKLPNTSDRGIETSMRSRPGDVVILGGLQKAMDNKRATSGLLSGSDVDSRARSEMVLILKARVIHFVNKDRLPAPAGVAVRAVPEAQAAVRAAE